MSSIEASLYRSGDDRILKVQFLGDFDKPHDYTLLSFKCESQDLDVISTSAGHIDDEGHVKIVGKNAELYVEYSTLGDKLECLAGYYAKNDLLEHEALTALFESNQTIFPTVVSIPYLKTVPGSFKARLSDFFIALDKRTSQWKLNISCPDDLMVDIASSGRNPTMVSFGEDSIDLSAADYVFRLDPQISRIMIPREVIQRQYLKYHPQCKLGIFEIIEPDFLGVKGAFYKNRISNLLTLADMVKIK